jgi:hypothetical protein
MIQSLLPTESFDTHWKPGETLTVVRELSFDNKREKIPTTFVPMAPEKLIVEENIDVLAGVFHIMWEDMPRRRTYRLAMEDLVSPDGYYIGADLRCGSVRTNLTQP